MLTLKARDIVIEFQRPLIMGVLNVTPDSFSDPGDYLTVESQIRRAQELIKSGADIIDVGGETAAGRTLTVSADAEIERVAPVIERLSQETDIPISIDTYKPQVAQAALELGAHIVNDISGLKDPELVETCRHWQAGLVIMHNRALPKEELFDYPYEQEVTADVVSFLEEKINYVHNQGIQPEQLIIDPGPDFGKTPAQTVSVLRSIEELHAFERPILMAVSRKDFIGVVTNRSPKDRLGGTLAAVAYGLSKRCHIFRVHDVAVVSDFIKVLDLLDGKYDLPADARLAKDLRWEPM